MGLYKGNETMSITTLTLAYLATHEIVRTLSLRLIFTLCYGA